MSKTSRSSTQTTENESCCGRLRKTYQNFGTVTGEPWKPFQRATCFGAAAAGLRHSRPPFKAKSAAISFSPRPFLIAPGRLGPPSLKLRRGKRGVPASARLHSTISRNWTPNVPDQMCFARQHHRILDTRMRPHIPLQILVALANRIRGNIRRHSRAQNKGGKRSRVGALRNANGISAGGVNRNKHGQSAGRHGGKPIPRRQPAQRRRHICRLPK